MALADRVTQQHRRHDREGKDAADGQRPSERRHRFGVGPGDLGTGIERVDQGRRPRRVVVVELAVRPGIDVPGRTFVLEVVERTQQEVTLGFEGLAVDGGHESPSGSTSPGSIRTLVTASSR